jgi:hypothetical protein
VATGRRTLKKLALLAALVAAAYIAATGARIYARKYYLFLPDYLRWELAQVTAPRAKAPTHLFVLFADHFEPNDVAALAAGGAPAQAAEAEAARRVREWGARYASMASRHADSRGRPPQHTWFYPGEQHAPAVLDELKTLVEHGFGEVEMHFHHEGDTEATFTPRFRKAIIDMQKHGFLISTDGQTHFAFVHGNFALDSGTPRYCGLTEELRILRELGCFADFTFPSVYLDSQPPSVNSIFAAQDDPQPKSYRRQFPLTALSGGAADLMIFEGPLVFAPSSNWRRLFLDLDDGDVHPGMPASPDRIERWIRANVHVAERPDWVFIKLFAHGISTPAEADAVVGPEFDALLTVLEQRYNDGSRYVLHYVTARQAYNLAMAAASGKKGGPDAYLDSTIPPYVAGRRDT